jgi:hypothetical protein
MDWVVGAMSIAAIYLQGRKIWWGWLVQLINQGFWLYIVVHSRLWGLLPVVVSISVLAAYNMVQWRKEVLDQAKRREMVCPWVRARCPSCNSSVQCGFTLHACPEPDAGRRDADYRAVPPEV